MANEIIRVFGTQKTLGSGGTAFGSGSTIQASTAGYSAETDGAGFPDAEFSLSFTYSSAPTNGSVISLLARLKNIEGTNGAQGPDRYIGNFFVSNVITTQYAAAFAYSIPADADYFLYNTQTGQTVSAGWVLKVKPMTFSVAA
jgi:hypothetical protein